jgi:hypothetical protein
VIPYPSFIEKTLAPMVCDVKVRLFGKQVAQIAAPPILVCIAPERALVSISLVDVGAASARSSSIPGLSGRRRR